MIASSYRVIYGDTDQMGVVYYANYLRFAEHGRNEYIRAKGMRYRDLEPQHRIHLPVVEAHLHYRQSARYDDLLRIETRVEQVRKVSLRFGYRILRSDDEVELVTGYTVHACITFEGKPTRLPEEIVLALEPTSTSSSPTPKSSS
jgi:acyl-CoA thioester hydrolase